MKVFLSGMEASNYILDYFISQNRKIDYILVSYYYLRKNKDNYEKIKKIANEILVDSGAHSFQNGKKVNWEEYTKEYANWIEENDSEQIIGYFEMDVDNVIGYDKVLELRKILEEKSKKIIPVWHKNRGIEDYKKMCENYKYIAITGFLREDIKDEQYAMFFKYAKECGCMVHCLGMIRTKILKKVAFDSVDSSSWKQASNYGRYVRLKADGTFKKYINTKRFKTKYLDFLNIEEYIKLQQYYKNWWRKNGSQNPVKK